MAIAVLLWKSESLYFKAWIVGSTIYFSDVLQAEIFSSRVLKHVHNHCTKVTSRLTSYLFALQSPRKYINCNLSFSCLPRLILFKSAKIKKAQEIISDTIWIYCAWKMFNKMAILKDKCKFECIIPNGKQLNHTEKTRLSYL